MIKVLDASALMALLLKERGEDLLTLEFLRDAVMSTVNITEVYSTLVNRGADPVRAWRQACEFISVVEPFTTEQARLAGSLILRTRSRGLSLGDRACLALAISLDAPVYTTDQTWKGLQVGCEIRLLR